MLCFEQEIQIIDNNFDLANKVYGIENNNAEENLKFLFKSFDCWTDIENISGEIELKFSRKDIHLLRKDVLFYFESLEDYETCNYVQKLCEIIE